MPFDPNSARDSGSPQKVMSALPSKADTCGAQANIRFGPIADICAATSDVCFTPNSDRESRLPQKAMSALPLKADVCGANRHVCFGPKADISPHSII